MAQIGFMEDVAAMLIGYTGVVKVLAGSIFKVQPLDVFIKKSFKYILREFWEDHVIKLVKDARDEANNNLNFKLNSRSRQDIVKWVHRRYIFLQNSNPTGNYMFKVNNRNTKTKCEICSKLTIKTPER